MKSLSNRILSGSDERPLALLARHCDPKTLIGSSLTKAEFNHVRSCLILAALLLFPVLAKAADNGRVRITVESSGAKVSVELESPVPTDRWSFRNTYAGVVGLGERIEDFAGYGDGGRRIVADQLAPGEFRTAQRVQRIGYVVKVKIPSRSADMSHVSWLTRTHGLLMMADILPYNLAGNSSPLLITLNVPEGWKVFSNEKFTEQGYIVEDSDKTIFHIGAGFRQQRRGINQTELVFLTIDDWPFSDSDAIKMAAKLINEYSKLTGHHLRQKVYFTLLSFPVEAGSAQWSADARGSSVVLLLGPNRSARKLSLARLGVILTHEIFHLWVPNSLRLQGSYDWFFEGFTLYQALRTALKVGLIDFREYLNTLGRVYDSYLAAPTQGELSLLALSERRWSSFSSLLYDKAMLVAFLCDLHLRKISDGRAGLSNLYSELFRMDAFPSPDANEVIISLLSKRGDVKGFLDQYVQGSARLNLGTLLPRFGIEVERIEFKTRLSVAEGIEPSQAKLLRSLGYRH